jgi:hypothetical protein
MTDHRKTLLEQTEELERKAVDLARRLEAGPRHTPPRPGWGDWYDPEE